MALDFSRIDAVCFDVDGTLSDTDDLWVARLDRFFSPLRFLARERDLRPAARRIIMGLETPGNHVLTFLDQVGLDGKLEEFRSSLARWPGRKPARFWMIERSLELLAELRRRYPMAVVSARDETSTRAFLDQFSLAGFFTSVVTSQTCRHTKPFPDPVLYAARQMGVDPTRCLMVGDTTVDIRAGKAAGAQTLGVLCGFGQSKELLKAGADLLLPTPAGLLDLL